MSDPTATRPRPRPRPRPRAPAPTASSPAGPSSSTAISSPAKNVDDEDALFIKNRSRTAQSWKKLGQISKDTKARVSHSPGDESDDVVEIDILSPRRKQKKAKPEVDMPVWARTNSIPRMLSSDNDDDDDDAFQDLANTPSGKREHAGSKRKRARSRSKSITPPPALPVHQIQNARNLVRQALESTQRPASPTGVGDESTDTIVLDPELAKIAQSVRNQARSQSNSSFSTSEALDMGGGPKFVTIKVKWQPHPLNEGGKGKQWLHQIKRHATFRELFDETADLACVLSDNLMMSYDNKRLFSSATPHSLGIWADAELVACDQTTYEYIRTNRHHRRSPSLALDYPSPSSSPPGDASDSEGEPSQEQDSGPKFKLILRSAVTTKDITLTVRPTTTCGAIVKAFLKSAGLAEKYPSVMGNTPGKNATKKGKKGAAVPALLIDGEKMNPTSVIGDADMEDGDLVEVIGL